MSVTDAEGGREMAARRQYVRLLVDHFPIYDRATRSGTEGLSRKRFGRARSSNDTTEHSSFATLGTCET